MSTVRAKQHDVGVTFTASLTLTTAADWTGATVRWLIKEKSRYNTAAGSGSFTGYGDGTENNSTTATVSYTSADGDLDYDGTYDQEWEVTFANGSIITFPSTGHNTLKIVQDLG